MESFTLRLRVVQNLEERNLWAISVWRAETGVLNSTYIRNLEDRFFPYKPILTTSRIAMIEDIEIVDIGLRLTKRD